MGRMSYRPTWPLALAFCMVVALVAGPMAVKGANGPPKHQPSPEQVELDAQSDAPVASELFFDSQVSRDAGEGGPSVLRTRYIQLNADLFAAVPSRKGIAMMSEAQPQSGGQPAGGGPPGEPKLDKPIRASLSFFDGQMHMAVFDAFERGALGSVSWFGRLEDVEDSEVILVVLDGVMAGSFRVGEVLYQLRYAGDGVHALEQIDPASFPQEAEPIRVDPEITRPDVEAPGDTGNLIDVLAVYTAAARAAAGGTTAMRARIALGITETNQAYAASGVSARVRLVHTPDLSKNPVFRQYASQVERSQYLPSLRG